MSHKSDSPRAFSLVELLVVIAIIGVLVSLLAPTLRKARESARLIECASRQKQIYLLVSAYREDNKQWYPACHYYA
jgi:prepilin-type N-terminal cleavage/methylation domain-containing protein